MISLNDKPMYLAHFAKLIHMDEHRLFRICKGIEDNGYRFNRNENGHIDLSENDITVVLSFCL
ncbi:hypothetical protein J2736_006233 [Paenibacillus qinlingensis]|uniref:Uncharacterized protein n=1 Tax=Paenibacillus qinlingensis TaxID=1837343 RepID=A0ABU1P5F7_9BACL|nr:hypothetical protein [Paenibacillus qinlingensis]